VTAVPAARHRLRARDLADARYSEPLTVADVCFAVGAQVLDFDPGRVQGRRGRPLIRLD
jgi:hypothetical protein